MSREIPARFCERLRGKFPRPTHPNRPILAALRLLFGLLIAAALGRQLFIQFEMGYSIANFFSYFTNLSNLFAAAVLVFGAFRFSRRRAASNIHDQLRATSVVNMTVVGTFTGLCCEPPTWALSCHGSTPCSTS